MTFRSFGRTALYEVMDGLLIVRRRRYDKKALLVVYRQDGYGEQVGVAASCSATARKEYWSTRSVSAKRRHRQEPASASGTGPFAFSSGGEARKRLTRRPCKRFCRRPAPKPLSSARSATGNHCVKGLRVDQQRVARAVYRRLFVARSRARRISKPAG